MAEPESIKSIMARGRIPGPKRKKQRLELLSANWEYIAGERVAAHSRPSRIARGTLTVSADSPAWAAEVAMVTETLRSRAAGIMGEDTVKRIRVQSRCGSGGGTGEEDTPREEDAGPDAGEIEVKFAEKIGAFEDEGMRRALERLVRASKSSNRGDNPAESSEKQHP